MVVLVPALRGSGLMGGARRGSDGSPFGGTLRKWRTLRGLNLRELAEMVHSNFGQLGKIERGETRPTRELVTRCEEALRSRGELIDAYHREIGRARPRELPPAPVVVVGRERHLAELDEALVGRSADAPSLVVIDGQAGVGKTTMALKWAHQVAHWFPDGQLYCDLKGFSLGQQAEAPARVLARFCIALGATSIPEDLEGRAALFRSLVSSSRVLIVLDNAANAEQVKPLLPGSAGCAVIVTSRRVMPGLTVAHDARRLRVAPLTMTDSITVISEIIGSRRVEAEPDAAAELAWLCGHLPLALRVAAELADLHPHRRIADLVEDLGDEDERLDRLDTDDDLTTPRAVFSASYHGLADSAARVFRYLGLHRGPHLSSRAIAALAGTSEREARTALRQLGAVHMLDTIAPGTSPDTAQLQDLLHAYARELVTAFETPAQRHVAAQRLILWFLHSMRAAGDVITPRCMAPLVLPELPADVRPESFATARDAVSWCDREQVNLVAISRMAAEYGPPGAAWKLAVASWPYMIIRTPWHVWRDTHQVGLETARAEHDELGEGWVATQWAEALRQQGRLEEAQQYYDHLRALRERSGDQYGSIYGLVGEARLALDRGQHDRARSLAQEAELKFGELGDLEGRVRALHVEARAFIAEGQPDPGFTLLHRALDLVDNVDRPNLRRPLLSTIADLHIARDNLEGALDALDRAAKEHAVIDDRLAEADLRRQAGDLRHRLHRSDDAEQDWLRARELYDELGDLKAVAALDTNLQQN